MDHARELSDLFDLSPIDDRLEAVQRDYAREWTRLVASNAAVQVAGPRTLANAAQDLLRAAGQLADIIDKRRHGQRWPPGLDPAREAVWKERSRFVAVTQQVYAGSATSTDGGT
ncbi:hypothetical protein [Micromonospora sp. NPDC050200]|uniref:hypothetical protein n=1 Tax=Micromonospora sp. NPDC050200 TaxID=3155664 RepID=UPI0033EC5981